MPELIVLCGVSYSGKTTFANTINEGNKYKIINTDRIREKLHGDRTIQDDESKVWQLFEQEKTKAINQHKNVILDACHLSPQARWHAKKYVNGHEVKIIVFNPSKKELHHRWKKEKRIKWNIIEDMFNNFTISEDKLKWENYKNITIIN